MAPSVTISEMPRKIIIPANVTMNDDTPTLATHTAFHAPRTMPARIAATTASHGFQPSFTVSEASTTPTSATAEPTDRSKLRVTINITALIDESPTIVACSASRPRLRCDRNSPSVRTWNTANTAATTISRV